MLAAKEVTLAGYTLLPPLGAGGEGQVFQARQQRLQWLAALKVIRNP